jgi:hypothetical protein
MERSTDIGGSVLDAEGIKGSLSGPRNGWLHAFMYPGGPEVSLPRHLGDSFDFWHFNQFPFSPMPINFNKKNKAKQEL